MLFEEENNQENEKERMNPEEVYVPEPSKTQLEVRHALYQLCWDDNRFEGPGLELRTGRCSHDIHFLGLNGEKIAYEIDGKDHNWNDDKKRDYFLRLKFGWTVFRVDIIDVDAFGFKKIAEMIHCHLLNELGIESGIVIPGIISNTLKINKRHLH
ncbi:hypothetical protein [Metabacillus indicus]|uniref:hypothetical protein n=1 Tax=Metabacillus indicus TaxID=246786 RepID=UPI003CE8A5DA